MLKNKKIAIVGGGASAQDAIALAFKNSPEQVHWVYRSLAWMIPTSKRKYEKSALRDLAIAQIIGNGTRTTNKIINTKVKEMYSYFGVEELIPSRPYDSRRDQAIPGRAGMIKNFEKIKRHKNEIKVICGNKLIFRADAPELQDIDVVVWCTGFEMDLKYLGLSEYSNVKKPAELRMKNGSHVISLSRESLYFLGGPNLDVAGSAPVSYEILMNTLIRHIQGKAKISNEINSDNINHWDMYRQMARFDKKAYFPFLYRGKLLLKAFIYKIFNNKPFSR
jgi:hypothetical protein